MPEALDKLMAGLGRLPGVGRRSAERMALAILQEPGAVGAELLAALQSALQLLTPCKLCGNITPRASDPCAICADPKRATGALCVVEGPADILLMERSGAFRGRYHALMGRLSPMRGEGVRQLRMDALLDRIRRENVTEVLLALDSDVEGDATGSYLREVLSKLNISVTRPARGIPAGGGLAYTDAGTLARAIENRQTLR